MTNTTLFVLLAISLCYLETLSKYKDQDVCCSVCNLPTFGATAFNMSLCKQFVKVMEMVCSRRKVQHCIKVTHSDAK